MGLRDYFVVDIARAWVSCWAGERRPQRNNPWKNFPNYSIVLGPGHPAWRARGSPWGMGRAENGQVQVFGPPKPPLGRAPAPPQAPARLFFCPFLGFLWAVQLPAAPWAQPKDMLWAIFISGSAFLLMACLASLAFSRMASS